MLFIRMHYDVDVQVYMYTFLSEQKFAEIILMPESCSENSACM